MSGHLPLPFSRSDFGTLQEMRFAPPPAVLSPPQPVPPPGREEVPLDELSFRHLRTPAEIAQVIHLRQEIQLPAAALADPNFSAREKKETIRASWVHLRCAELSSERFGSYR